jgi:hypothetical protein
VSETGRIDPATVSTKRLIAWAVNTAGRRPNSASLRNERLAMYVQKVAEHDAHDDGMTLDHARGAAFQGIREQLQEHNVSAVRRFHCQQALDAERIINAWILGAVYSGVMLDATGFAVLAKRYQPE